MSISQGSNVVQLAPVKGLKSKEWNYGPGSSLYACRWGAVFGESQLSRSVVSESLQPHGLQHTRLSCPSPTTRAYSNSCPLSRWCHPTLSTSVDPYSSCPLSLPASGSFPMSQFFTSGGQSSGGLKMSCREGNGNQLQYSCLENPMDRGAWQATVHRVAKSQTWLKWLNRDVL